MSSDPYTISDILIQVCQKVSNPDNRSYSTIINHCWCLKFISKLFKVICTIESLKNYGWSFFEVEANLLCDYSFLSECDLEHVRMDNKDAVSP